MTSFFSTTPDPTKGRRGPHWVLAIQRRNYRPFYSPLNPFLPFYTLFLLLRHALEIFLDVGIGELIVLQIAVEELLVGGHVDETVT